jgi:hypothetical protein
MGTLVGPQEGAGGGGGGGTSGIDLSLAGNTSGTLTLLSSGTAILAGGSNITLSQNGQSITISAGGGTQSVQTQNLFDLSLAGNTSGTLSLVSSGTAILAGGNNITLSQVGQSITISANNESGAGISIGGNSTSAGAGYSNISTGTAVLAGGNNITLSQNGASITISQQDPLVSYFEPAVRGQTLTASLASASFLFQPFVVSAPIAMYRMYMYQSLASAQSTFSMSGQVSQTTQYTANGSWGLSGTLALFSRVSTGTNTNSSRISSFYSNSYSASAGMNLTVSESVTNASTATVSYTYLLNAGYLVNIDSAGNITTGSTQTSNALSFSITTNANASVSTTAVCGVFIGDVYTGLRALPIPLNTTLTPGEYWMMYAVQSGTGSTNINFSNQVTYAQSLMYYSTQAASNFLPWGSTTTTAGTNVQQGWGILASGTISNTTIALNTISNNSNYQLWFNMMAITL